MSEVKLPWCYPAHIVDRMIAMGELPVLDIQCSACGAMGEYDNWLTVVVDSTGSRGGKLCPGCGLYKGKRI